MKHGSLFSGIGGFDLAAEWMGWENVFHCEWNPFGQQVLKHYWPKSISYADITKTDFSIHRGNIDILTGGFPCQPYSQAGKRLGKEDDRHLWPEMLRAIGEIQPRWVVGENVRGLTNWNGGLVFDEVQSDLESQGYEVTPFLLPAVAVNAPHRRDRIWFVAYSKDARIIGRDGFPGDDGGLRKAGAIYGGGRRGNDGNEIKGFGIPGTSTNTGSNGQQFTEKPKGEFDMERDGISLNELNPLYGSGFIANTPNSGVESMQRERTNGVYKSGTFADTHGGPERTIRRDETRFGRVGPEHTKHSNISGDGDASNSNGFRLRGQGNRIRESRFASQTCPGNNWQDFPTQSPVCNGDDEFSTRLDGITFSKWRNESIKSGGNAVVPALVLQIFKAIEQYEAI